MKRYKIIERPEGKRRCGYRFEVKVKGLLFWKLFNDDFESVEEAENFIHRISGFSYHSPRTYHTKTVKEIIV
jgi:hypothetical protein